MSDNLEQLETWLDPLLNGLVPAQRKQLTRAIGIELRTRQQTRIKQQLNPDGSPYAARKPRLRRKQGRIKRRGQMFAKLRQARHMKVVSAVDGVAIGYGGRAAAIARVHQEGLLAKVVPGGPLYQYPMRQLLGWSDDDRLWVLEQIIDSIGVK